MMAHLVTVALTVMRGGFDDETVAAALLHDSVEDANRAGERLREAVIEEAMGPRVAALVRALTEPKEDAEGRKLDWQTRKDVYVAQLQAAPVEAAAISLADKVHNLWTTSESMEAGVDPFLSTPQRRGLSAGPEQQRWFYQAVHDATLAHTDARLVPLRAALTAEMARFERLAGLGGIE